MNWYNKTEFFKLASRQILYHGTAIKNLKSIMSQGLIPNPKERAWADDPDETFLTVSRASFPGIYLTNNFNTARISSKRGGMRDQGVVIAAQIETRTLALDEDRLGWIMGAMNMLVKGGLSNRYQTVETYYRYLDGDLEVELNENVHEFMLEALQYIDPKSVDHVIKNAFPVIKNLLIALLIRNLAWINSNEEDLNERFLRDGRDINEIPTFEKASETLRKYTEEATRKLAVIIKGGNELNYTARALEPITFSGANKILSIVSWTISDKDHEMILKFWYGGNSEAAQKMAEDCRQFWGEKVTVI
jgi:hypothetical protein